jgi:hypothetical protein
MEEEDENEDETFMGWRSKKVILKHAPPKPKLPPDFSRVKRKKKLQRVVFSPTQRGYAIDIMVIKPSEYYYLILQNINTRYVWAFPIYDKTKESVFPILQYFQHYLAERTRQHERATQLGFEDGVDPEFDIPAGRGNNPAGRGMSSLTGDAERAWDNDEVKDWLKASGVKVDFRHSDYIHHVPILDSTIKTLRMGANYDIDVMMDEDNFERLVFLFNNSVNRNTKLTPTEMETYEELEWAWIRHCQRHNKRIERDYYWRYEIGNILLVHFDESKTSKRFEKHGRRRQYNELCEFVGYAGMNLAVKRLNEDETEFRTAKGEIDGRRKAHKKTYIIPFYDAVWVARNVDTLPKEYDRLLS